MAKLYNDLVLLASEWETVALNLGLVEDISNIDEDGKNVESKLRKVLIRWKTKRPKPYTWRTITEILREPSLEQNKLADKIEQAAS